VAGWVLATRTPLVIEEVGRDPRFAKDVAEDTGYVSEGPDGVPLLHEERALGVLEVLDRTSKFTLEEMELLGLFATQAAIARDLLQRARDAEATLRGAADSQSWRGSPPRSSRARTRPAPASSPRSRTYCANAKRRPAHAGLPPRSISANLAGAVPACGVPVRLDVVAALVRLAGAVPARGMAVSLDVFALVACGG
jgi:hypothetical protein